jgi:CheY-like chemotaxis protein
MSDLSGVKVLLVEDEGGVALMLEDMLSHLGCEIVASVARLAEACEVARTVAFDFALLDVNLAGQLVFPVAEILRQRNIPFTFSTGYGQSGIPREFGTYPVLSKPYSIKQLAQVVTGALSHRA